MLTLHIDTRLHDREGLAVTNFAGSLPPPTSDLAQQATRDPYLFDFLTLHGAASEREVEDALVTHIQRFLLELGAGFAFVGRQYHLEVGGDDCYIDLLFAISRQIDQVIWGEFESRRPREACASLLISAIDSSYWEVFGSDACLAKIRSTFRDVRPASRGMS